MAALSGGEVRVRLLFEYPPPALPQSRQLWFLLDTGLCRAVTDVSALIRERFFCSRRGALALYLDGCLLPPGESVRLIRDNETISVKWEETCPPKSPHQMSRKRQRSEDESDDYRDLKKMRDVLREASKKRGKVTPEEEEEVSDRPKKKKKKKQGVMTPEEVSNWAKENNVEVAPEEISKRPKKKNKGEVNQDEVSERSKKNKEEVTSDKVSERPKKKNKGEVTPDEVIEWPKKKKEEVTPNEVSERPKKNKKVVTTDKVTEWPKNNNKVEMTLEEVNKRPKKNNKGEVTPEEVSDQPKKEKARSPQQDSELLTRASEKEPKKHDISKKPRHVVTYQGEPCSTVEKEASPPVSSTTATKEPSSSSSSDQEDTGWKAKPGPSLKAQQKDNSSNLDSFSIEKPLMSGDSSYPYVHNGHVAREGAQHKPPLKIAGCGLGRGRGIENLPLRGRGSRGQGKAQLQNHFFYNSSPETLKQQHLNEDASNVSVVIQNPPEVLKRDYSTLPLLAAAPQPGNVIAFKLLELTENYTPEVSDFKEGRILGYDPLSQQLEMEVLSQPKKKYPGKFDLVYEGENGKNIVEYAMPQECKITQVWSSLIEPRLMTEFGPQQHATPVAQGD